MSDNSLFSGTDIFHALDSQTQAVSKRVQALPSATVLNASEHDLVQALVDDLSLNVPVIQDDEIHIATSSEIQVDVNRDPERLFLSRSESFYTPGTKTVIAVPFEGDAGFLRVRPQSYTLNPPRGTIEGASIHLTYVRTDHDGEALKQEYQRDLAAIKKYLDSLRASAELFNRQLEGLASSELKARKARLLADAGMAAAIGLPIKKREGSPTTYAVPVKRRALKLDQIHTEKGFRPEPAISADDYEEIIRIMRSMVQVMELSPHAFREMGEEDIRSHFLVQLNGAFKGLATGETFNFQGKTDILIRVEGKNIFIAECKVWKGEKGLLEAIDQLLSYLSWRDTKAAILVFNRTVEFTTVLSRLAAVAPTHPHCKRTLGQSDESSFRYVFAQPNDKNREITISILAFDIPRLPAGSASS